ncbi:MAG: chromosomal replication initiator protein DnaA [Acidobacteria bacterium]|nr:MAG: chromosomal replication initiator protein DnaA [Acidobacteriota bacterium]PYR09366.1 MAG: chromosomal replication initiator protein DnaA [Acidobacteriota bacterium]
MNLWDQLLARIETKIGRHAFYTWFRPTAFVAEDRNSVTIRVPNPLFQDWLTKHYSGVIAEAMAEVLRPNLALHFVSDPNADAAAIALSAEEAAALEQAAEGVPHAPAAAGLNPRYTFDTFIVGSSNQFAHAACRAVAEAPSRSYNPLFIYGGVGLGKTHLMHAVGQYVFEHDRNLKLTYISSERFMNEMINAVRYDRVLDFRERYRSIDVLLVDDIQFLAGKEGTQTEFFHTFNALYDSQKQIVLSSDCPPHEIRSIEERLRSRFEWGLIADIQSPDLETKVAILKKKAETETVPLPDNVAMYIAGKIKSNVRELEGSLIRLIAYASLTGQEISLPLAQQVLRNIIDHEDKAITIEAIQKFVAEHYNLKMVDLKSRNNSKSIAMPRQVAMYLCKSLTDASLPEIGRSFGGKHHSTVIHSIRKVEDLRKKDSNFNSQISNFLEGFR